MRNKSIVTSLCTAAALFALTLGAPSVFAADPLHPSYRVIDADKDGKLTSKEFMAYMEKQWADIQADQNPLHPNHFSPVQFKEADTDGNKKISEDEFMAYVKMCWGMMDKDGKGVVAETIYSGNNNPLNPNFKRN